MADLIVRLKRNKIHLVQIPELMTSGSAGYISAIFYFDDAWDGLTKNVIFKGSNDARIIPDIIPELEYMIPWEIMQKPGPVLVGVEGRREDGTVVIPTVMMRFGVVHVGADDEGSEAEPPTPTVLQRILALVQGFVARVEKVGNTATITLTDHNGTTVAQISDGEPGFSPAVQVTETEDGHRIDITDETHTESFEVLDGRDATDDIDDGVVASDKLWSSQKINREISDSTSDMATQTWVGEQGYITEGDIPVVSVNGKTGVVVLTASDLGLTNLFTLKGSKTTVSDLPASGNVYGDVWYVIAESVGYIWLNDGTSDRWEQLGLSVDLSNYVTSQQLATALAGYVEKVSGKGLSSNDFTDAYKQKIDDAVTALSGKVDKITGKGLSSNDFTDQDQQDIAETKQALSQLSGKVDGMYTNDQIDDMLADYVTYVPLTIRCIASDDSVPSPVTISVKSRPSGDVYQTLTFTGAPVTCRVPEGFAYMVTGSDDLADYYSPVPVSGIATEATNVSIRYSKIGVIETFADIQTVTRIGKASQIFDLDDQIEVDTSGSFGKLQFDVVDFDNVHIDADSTEHTLNLLLHDVLYGYQISAAQALIACPNGLPAGMYHFTLPTTYGSWVAGTYQFTTTVAVPEGGQLKLSSGSGNSTPLTNLTLQMYASPYSTQIIESVAIASGDGGQNLGNWASAASAYNGVYINHWQRVAYGSNNYEQSALDQWLNAEGTNWWVAKCMFDRPPSYVNQEGLLSQLDPEFVAVLGNMTVKCHTNTVYEAPDAPHPVSTLYTIKRKIYLVSRMEIFGNAESAAMTDGSKQYSSYAEKTENADRIKYDHTESASARSWWTRTPSVGYSSDARSVNHNGARDNSYAFSDFGAVPACTIC